MLTVAWLAATSAQAAPTHADRLLAPAAACPEATGGSPAAQLATMTCLVGYARAHAGLSTLRESNTLARAGALKIDADIRCGTFTHTPCGQPFDRVFTTAGFSLGGSYSIGENLAYGRSSLGSPAQIMGAWLASPEHRKNLLSTSYTTFGLAVRADATFLGMRHIALWANEFAGP